MHVTHMCCVRPSLQLKHSVERHLWTYGFYGVIESYRSASRRFGHGDPASTSEETQFREFLLEAEGFYGNLLVKLGF